MKKIVTSFTVVVLFLALLLPTSLASGNSAIIDIVVDPYAFNSETGSTSINYTLIDVDDGNVSLEIYDSDYDLESEPIRTVNGGVQNSGTHSIIWDGTDDDGGSVNEGDYVSRLNVSIGSYKFTLKWEGSGTLDDQFNRPYDIVVDSSGNVYVADTYNHRIQKFDSNGNFFEWESLDIDDGQFNCPTGVAVDSSGNIYVADRGNHRIQKFDSDGNFLTEWGSYGTLDGPFDPFGVTVNSSGNIYVTDCNNHRIQKFDSDGDSLTEWGSYGTDKGEFDCPTGVTVDSDGNVYVADCNNDRIQKFDSDGKFLGEWGSYGFLYDGEFRNPIGIAVDSSGNVYVVDFSNHRIQKFDSNGIFLGKWGSYGFLYDGEFRNPIGITVDSSGNVYVADTDNDRIQKFDFDLESVITSNEVDILIDNTAPEVSIITPVDGAEYILNEPALAGWLADDSLSGIASVTATIPDGGVIDTATVGEKTFSVVAVDKAGNQTIETRTYYVRYVYSGVFPPIRSDGSSVFKLGSGLSVKFQLWDANGDFVTDASAKLWLAKKNIDGTFGEEIAATSSSSKVTDNEFDYNSFVNKYFYKLRTKDLTRGTWRLRIELDDGTSKFAYITFQ